MITPDFAEFRRLALRGNLIPVCEVLPADLLTPVSAFLRIAPRSRASHAFLLESVDGGERLARYSFLGCDPFEIIRGNVRGLPAVAGASLESRGKITRHDSGLFDLLRSRLARFHPIRFPGLPPFSGGAIGYLAYDAVRLAEKIPATHPDDVGAEDAVFMLFDGLIAFDHVRQAVWLIRNVFTEGPGSLRAKYDAAVRSLRSLRASLERPLPREPRPSRSAPLRVRSDFPRARFLDAVRRAKRYIRAGDVFQVVLSQRFTARTSADPLAIYRALRVVNPSPYMYFLRTGPLAVVGSSPEMLVKVQGRDAFYRPIAGTRPRGRDEREDLRFERDLLADPKERAEHIMLVDLGRNDLGRVSEYGSVRVDQLMSVERYSHVMHLVSSLRSRLRPDVDCFDALMSCFPAGTLSGAPKVRAMQIIEELEPTRRGIYGGAVLYLDYSGNMDSCIAIRTLVAKGGTVYVQAGAGIVADSVPAREHAECVAKASALLSALRHASGRA
ncbi:MAG TPA: anthranilate synthase component I [Patescibacteria group bacterium]|nr:anthranilate synthase component I [Patescibacteria group bacterium]